MPKEDPALISELRRAYSYDPVTGVLTNAQARQNVAVGTRAGTKTPFGYRVVNFKKTLHREHRVIFAIVEGRWPAHQVDHKNHIRDDNRWENLREATPTQNLANSVYKNASGFKGAYATEDGKWQALISIGGKLKFLGRFDTPEGAHAAYKAAAEKLHGEFARTEPAYLD